MNHIKNFAKQALAGVIALAGAAVLIGVLSPKAVHAAVAALVEVANTPANPVPNADVARSVANLVYLQCVTQYGCYQLKPGGATDDNIFYTVPEGQYLVVTNVQVNVPYSPGASTYFSLGGTVSGPQSFGTEYFVPADGMTHSFQVSGPVYPPGSILPPQGATGLTALVSGYLTPN